MYIYDVREDNITDEDGKARTVFGIEVIDGSSDGVKVVRSVKDVFLGREEAVRFVGLCNALKLSLIHLDDVIEDAIS